MTWMPYGRTPAQHMPSTTFVGYILYHDNIEPYMPDRVLR